MKLYEGFYRHNREDSFFIKIPVPYDDVYFIDELFDVGTEMLHGDPRHNYVFIERAKAQQILDSKTACKKTKKMLEKSIVKHTSPSKKEVYIRTQLLRSDKTNSLEVARGLGRGAQSFS